MGHDDDLVHRQTSFKSGQPSTRECVKIRDLIVAKHPGNLPPTQSLVRNTPTRAHPCKADIAAIFSACAIT